MSHDLRVGLVIPCYNESERIDIHYIERQLKSKLWLKILFVDDGSNDKTYELISSFCSSFNDPSPCEILRFKKNKGKGEAVRRGMKKLCDDREFDIIGFWDADMATPLDSIEKMLMVFEKKKTVLAVIGSRVRLCGKNIKRGPLRHYLGRLFVTFINLFINVSDIYDTQCGAKLFRKEVLQEVIDKEFKSRWLFDIELFFRISNSSGQEFSSWLYEYPLEKWSDIPGSKVTFKAFVKAFIDIMKIWNQERKR